MPGDGAAAAVAADVDGLWAKAAELERHFERYKRRLAERSAAAGPADAHSGGGSAGAAAGRGRRYEAYVRVRDEKLRQGWRARMERKEAEMKALWARLDRGRRPSDAADGGGLAAIPTREQKPLNLEVKPIAPATPRSSSSMKLSRPRTSMSSSPAAAASPRLSSRRPLHREPPPPQPEPPATPRKENRVPTQSPAATTPRLKALSRSRSFLKDKERGCSSARDTPRRPLLQPPRASHDGDGDLKLKSPPVLAPGADAMAVNQSCLDEQVTFHLGGSGDGAVHASPPLAVIPTQLDGCIRLDSIGCDSVDISEYSDVEAKNLNIDESKCNDGYDEIVQSSDKLGDVKITGDSDTEPSYVYIKKDDEEKATKSCEESPGSEEEKEATENLEDTMASSDTIARESPVNSVIDAEAASLESSESLYSNVQSSFSHGSELVASATDSPLQGSPMSGGLSTEQLPESDASRLRKNLEAAAAAADKSIMLTPSTPRSGVSAAVQSPMDAVAGLKRFLNFGRKNSRAGEAAVAAGHAPPSVAAMAGEDSTSEGWLSGDAIKPRVYCSSMAASDDLDSSYIISPHVRSLQSFVPLFRTEPELKEIVLAPPAKSPRVHRLFFSFTSFKSRGS